MDTTTKRELEFLDREMLEVRRESAELSTFGWRAFDPLKAYDRHSQDLRDVENAIRTVSPDDVKSMEKLVTRESVLIEAVQNAARSARDELKREQLAFFAAHDKFTKPLDAEIEKADKTLVKALEQMHKALQGRWVAMNNKKAVQRHLALISDRHNTTPQIGESDTRLPKPFGKKDLGNFRAYVLVFMERVTDIFGNGETARPEDMAESVYRQ